MIRRRSLRTRLLAIVLVGVVALTVVNVLVSAWGLGRVHDRAVANNASAQQQSAESALLTLANERADATYQRLNAVERIATVARQQLTELGPAEAPDWALALRTTSDGRRYYQGKTTLLLPSSGDQIAPDDGAANQTLDLLFPSLARTLPEIARISYLTTLGSIRSYPAFDPAKLQPAWTAHGDVGYQAGARAPSLSVKWTSVHAEMLGSRRVISAVAPVHQSGRFKGVVVIDIRLDQLTAGLKRLTVAQTGFAFLINSDGHLVTAPEQGQVQLIGHVMSPTDVGIAAIDIPSLASALTDMRSSDSGVATVDVRGQPFVLAYAGIPSLKWSLGLLAPVEEIVASVATTTGELTSIAGETRALGLLTSLAALALLVLALTYWLNHWLIGPLASLTTATAAVAAGDLRHIKVGGDDEIGRLAASFNQMTEALEASRTEITATNQQLEQKVHERTADLDLAVKQLERSFAAQQDLLRVLREVSVPIIPVIAGVLAMPLIGQIDDERVRHMTSALLARVERDRARTVLLDITGVSMIDASVAEALLQAVHASRLLGAEVVLVGVSPEVAQTIVALGIDLSGLRIAADLQSAVAEISRRRAESYASAGTLV